MSKTQAIILVLLVQLPFLILLAMVLVAGE